MYATDTPVSLNWLRKHREASPDFMCYNWT